MRLKDNVLQRLAAANLVSNLQDSMQIADANDTGQNAGIDHLDDIAEAIALGPESVEPEPPESPTQVTPRAFPPNGSPFGIAEPPQQSIGHLYQAPVTRSQDYSFTPRLTPDKIRLSKEPVDIARLSGISLADYASGVIELERRKALGDIQQ